MGPAVKPRGDGFRMSRFVTPRSSRGVTGEED